MLLGSWHMAILMGERLQAVFEAVSGVGLGNRNPAGATGPLPEPPRGAACVASAANLQILS